MVWWEKDKKRMEALRADIETLILQVEAHFRSINEQRSRKYYTHYDCKHSRGNYYTVAWTKDGLTYNREGEEPVLVRETKLKSKDYMNVVSKLSILETHLRNEMEIASLELVKNNLESHLRGFANS